MYLHPIVVIYKYENIFMKKEKLGLVNYSDGAESNQHPCEGGV